MKTTTQIGELETVENKEAKTIKFQDALDIAIKEFKTGKPQKRLRKNFDKQIDFCLNGGEDSTGLKDAWEHNLYQIENDLGKRKYHFQSKNDFLESYIDNPFSGLDYLQSDYNNTFFGEVETDEDDE